VGPGSMAQTVHMEDTPLARSLTVCVLTYYFKPISSAADSGRCLLRCDDA